MMDENLLLKRLTERNAYFNKMVNMIPPRFYFSNEDQQAGFHGKESTGKIPQHKIQKKKTKNKKQKLDPTQHTSVTQIQEEIADQEEKERNSEKEKIEIEEEADNAEEDESDNEIDDSEPKSTIRPISVEDIECSESIEVLREKLHSRIEKLKKTRHMRDGMNNDLPKKQAKKQRQEEKKQKWEAIKKSQIEIKNVKNGQISGRKENKSSEPMAPPVVNNEGEVVFSKFAFTESSEKKKKWVKKNQPRSNKDYARLLLKAEMDGKKMKELKEKDPEKAKVVEEKQAWKKALQKAQGIKIKDNPELIKKSMKKQKKIKQQSAKKWKERIEQQENVKREKQEKRTKNIMAKKSQKHSKKVKRLQKKGKLLPGF